MSIVSLELPLRGDSNEYTQLQFHKIRKFPKYLFSGVIGRIS